MIIRKWGDPERAPYQSVVDASIVCDSTVTVTEIQSQFCVSTVTEVVFQVQSLLDINRC